MPQILKWLHCIPSNFHILSSKLISSKDWRNRNSVINEDFSNLLLNALGMVEYDAQNKYESMQETGDNFQESGE